MIHLKADCLLNTIINKHCEDFMLACYLHYDVPERTMKNEKKS